MHSTSILIMAGAIGLVLGALLTLLLMRGRHKTIGSPEEAELRLRDANSKLEDFQAQVNEHFDRSSQLIHNLSQNYREIHEHMVNSALRLSSPDIGRQMLKAGSGKLSDNDVNLSVQPPRDWAPKNPDSKGILSEDFGLEEDTLHTGDHRATR